MKPDIDAILAGFPCEIPVFPLAGVVLFPGAVLPLHIFEPRYREMVRDASAGDQLVCIALLKQCTREEYEDAPPFHSTVCVGHIVHQEPLDDGRVNIALLGLSAARAEAVDSEKPYRTANVELLADAIDTGPAHDPILESICAKALPGDGALPMLREQLSQFLTEDHIPAALINTCALTAPVFPAHKLELLEERSLARRLDRLAELLERSWQWN